MTPLDIEAELRLDAYFCGMDAGYEGRGPIDNPHKGDRDLAELWDFGHSEGVVDALEEWDEHLQMRAEGLDPLDLEW